MQPARPDTVAGTFDGAPHEDRGAAVRFARGADGYTAETGGRIYAVRDTFGVYPLQQYLAELPGGRLQVLPLVWDAHPQAAGGQRWFNPSPWPNAAWTGRDGTWIYVCRLPRHRGGARLRPCARRLRPCRSRALPADPATARVPRTSPGPARAPTPHAAPP